MLVYSLIYCDQLNLYCSYFIRMLYFANNANLLLSKKQCETVYSTGNVEMKSISLLLDMLNVMTDFHIVVDESSLGNHGPAGFSGIVGDTNGQCITSFSCSIGHTDKFCLSLLFCVGRKVENGEEKERVEKKKPKTLRGINLQTSSSLVLSFFRTYLVPEREC
ncbi:hypothetical protein RIF29_22119 [Crotalaria pallida]|uniref:Uncharacterized protein n=1 Tax=Crotalaria pallida TaxID=3830 RepID=A0AAN9I6J6_CROPI